MPGTIDNEALLGELRALYARVDAHYADWTCPSSTECCRFGITGRQPYVTSIELALVERAIAKRGGMPSPKKRALPLTKDTPRERICPLLNRDNRCSIYSDRPFGCRTFFCDRATQGEGPSRPVLQGHVNELRDLAERHKLGGDAPRPLMRALTLASFALALIGTSAEAAPKQTIVTASASPTVMVWRSTADSCQIDAKAVTPLALACGVVPPT